MAHNLMTHFINQFCTHRNSLKTASQGLTTLVMYFSARRAAVHNHEVQIVGIHLWLLALYVMMSWMNNIYVLRYNRKIMLSEAEAAIEAATKIITNNNIPQYNNIKKGNK